MYSTTLPCPGVCFACWRLQMSFSICITTETLLLSLIPIPSHDNERHAISSFVNHFHAGKPFPYRRLHHFIPPTSPRHQPPTQTMHHPPILQLKRQLPLKRPLLLPLLLAPSPLLHPLRRRIPPRPLLLLRMSRIMLREPRVLERRLRRTPHLWSHLQHLC